MGLVLVEYKQSYKVFIEYSCLCTESEYDRTLRASGSPTCHCRPLRLLHSELLKKYSDAHHTAIRRAGMETREAVA